MDQNVHIVVFTSRPNEFENQVNRTSGTGVIGLVCPQACFMGDKWWCSEHVIRGKMNLARSNLLFSPPNVL